MAFKAEMNRRHWYCIIGVNMIHWYRKKLYDDWWNSLTEEEKLIVEENRRKRKEKSDRELKECIARLGLIHSYVKGLNTPYL